MQRPQRNARKTTFLSEGGFNGIGAFSEPDDPRLYERKAGLTLVLACEDLTLHRGFGRRLRQGAGGHMEGQAVEDAWIVGRARCLGAELSILGSQVWHDHADLTIRRSQENRFGLRPMRADWQGGQALPEHFVLEADLFAPLFDGFLGAISAPPHQQVRLTLRLDGAAGVFAPWEAPGAEGQRLKFLADRQDVADLGWPSEMFRPCEDWATGDFDFVCSTAVPVAAGD